MWKRCCAWALSIVALVFLSTAALPVIAQSTGSSFGGGSFGGGGSYSGGSSSSSYGGGSSSSSSYGSGGSYSSGGSDSGGGGDASPATIACILVCIVIYMAVMFYNASIPGGIGAKIRARRQATRAWNQMDVSAIRIGIDWRARKAVQDRLTELAESGRTDTPTGLAHLLRETVVLLQRSEIAWLYANVSNFHPMSAASAEGIFRQLGTQARAQFSEELLRNTDGSVSRDEASELRAHPNEGEGVVVVTLIVAAKREIVDVETPDHADHLKRLLDDVLATANPETLAALEVIWSPAAENDRMSTAELEQHYPDLEKIDETSIAGRVFCEYCQGPYAMELLTCPHCGAPGARA